MSETCLHFNETEEDHHHRTVPEDLKTCSLKWLYRGLTLSTLVKRDMLNNKIRVDAI
jgi:hypothetical protein